MPVPTATASNRHEEDRCSAQWHWLARPSLGRYNFGDCTFEQFLDMQNLSDE
jgi:hypothetical protein